MLRELPAAYSLLRAADLKLVATSCGLANSGTKADILARIAGAAVSQPTSSTAPRILSIDLGLRNLAYSLVTPTKSRPAKKSSKNSYQLTSTVQDPLHIHLHAWQRHELVPKKLAGTAQPEDFSPSTISMLALDLVKNCLVPLAPTHVLIERQRFRTMGSSQVQEWTLRVNMLEAMLHAIFRVMSDSGQFHGSVMSIPPSRATNFWLGPALKASLIEAPRLEAEKNPVKRKKTKMDSKNHKIDLVANWLTKGDVISTDSPTVSTMARSFLHSWNKTRRARDKVGKTANPTQSDHGIIALAKLDDLADSLLQGMAWLIWQRNTANLTDPDMVPSPPKAAFRASKKAAS